MSFFIMLKIVAIKNTVSQHSTSGKAGKVGVLNDSDNPNIDPTDIQCIANAQSNSVGF